MAQVVLITGAATGFGRLAAETMAQRGYTVFATMRDIAGRNAPHREALETQAKRQGWALYVLDLDVTQDASVEKAVQQAIAKAGRIDVAINNAGIAALGVTEAFPPEQFQRVFDVNVYGAVRVNRAVLPGMRKQRSGLLIHVSSGAGRYAIPCLAAYCASKFALEALADSYRFELTPFGVDSVIVEPGMHRTPILEAFMPAADQARVADYGVNAQYAERVQARFEQGSSSPQTPGPEPVVEAFISLIEMPVGERPFRTVPTESTRAGLDPYNAMAAQLRPGLAKTFNVTELLTMRGAAARG
jgi:NAD(P)-dependent dehydrogenase (short-subunit alcohol dehydrogenase family)